MSTERRWDLGDERASLIERYRAVSSCLVSDGLSELGLSPAGLDGIVTLDLSAKVVGPAFTVTCLPAAESENARIEYLADIPAGSVVTIANGGRTDCSVWGGQRTLAAHQRGAVGTVVDGAYRDIPEHLGMSYPVFARARTVVGSRGFANPVASQETIELAGISVFPGDLVLGDASGVVVVPSAHVREVLELAERDAADELRIAAEVRAGRDYFAVKARD
jgi:4-hydroxy-4-methyl-2-oxoglutarate aldolase